MREFFALWTTLGRTLEIYQSDMHQMHLGQEAFKLIRAIRGRTADLELLRLSEVAAKIEGYVRLLDPHDAPGQRPVFAELFRLLSLGHEARNAYAAQAEVLIQEPPPRTVMQVPGQLGSDRVPAAPVGMPRGGREAVGQPSAARAGAVEAPQSPVHVGVVLLVGSEHTLQRSEGRSTSLIDAQIIFTTSAEEALSVIAAGKRVDEAVIDVSVTTVRGAIDLSRELRKRGLNDLLPIAFLCPPDYKVEPAERLIAGCSLVVAAPCTQQKFEDCMIRLSSLKNAKSNGNPAQPDEETGLLCERDFLIRTNTELINSGRSNREMVLCFIRLAETNQTALGASDPLIAPVIEKILRCSFPVETLRGRWADGFGLLFCNEDWHYVEQALKKWSQELAQVTVAASNGSRIPLYMDWSLGKYPLDGFSLDALLSAARSSGRSGAR